MTRFSLKFASMTEEIIPIWHTLPVEDVVRILNSDLKKGLSTEEVRIRHKEYASNALPEEKVSTKFQIFLNQFKSSLIYILAAAGGITFIMIFFLIIFLI